MTQFQPAIPATRCRPPALVQVFPGGVILGACGCSSPPPAAPDRLASATAAQTSTRVVPVVSSPTRPSDASETIPASRMAHVYGYTYQQPDGNRLVVGWGALPEATAVDIRLAGQPL